MSSKQLVTVLFLFIGFSLLSACVNLPLDAAVKAENGQSEESRFSQSLRPKSGMISVLGNDGNIYTLNQAGEDITSITLDANLTQ